MRIFHRSRGMPGLGKAFIASICEYVLSPEVGEWFPTVRFIVHQTARMVRELHISHTHLLGFLTYSINPWKNINIYHICIHSNMYYMNIHIYSIHAIV